MCGKSFLQTHTPTYWCSQTEENFTGKRCLGFLKEQEHLEERVLPMLFRFSGGEKIRAILPVDTFTEDRFVLVVTEKGIIKKTSLSAFSRPRPSGIIAISTDLEDTVKEAKISEATNHVFIVTKSGMSIRFDEKDVRPMGRSARGVKGITLGENDQVVGVEVIPKDCEQTILIVTSTGYGKRTTMSEYRSQSRGGVGIITQKVTDKVGHVVGARLVDDSCDIMIATDKGQTIRMSCSEISKLGRNTQGVRLINLKPGEFVTGFAVIADESDNEDSE